MREPLGKLFFPMFIQLGKEAPGISLACRPFLDPFGHVPMVGDDREQNGEGFRRALGSAPPAVDGFCSKSEQFAKFILFQTGHSDQLDDLIGREGAEAFDEFGFNGCARFGGEYSLAACVANSGGKVLDEKLATVTEVLGEILEAFVKRALEADGASVFR